MTVEMIEIAIRKTLLIAVGEADTGREAVFTSERR